MYRRDAIRFQGLDAILGGWMDWLCGTDSLDRMWLRNQSRGYEKLSAGIGPLLSSVIPR